MFFYYVKALKAFEMVIRRRPCVSTIDSQMGVLAFVKNVLPRMRPHRKLYFAMLAMLNTSGLFVVICTLLPRFIV